MAKTNELPHDLLSERSLLGCLLIDGGAFEDISDLKLVKEDFYDPRFGIIYDCIRSMSFDRKPIDLVTVCSELSHSNKLDSVGGKEYLTEVIEDQASSVNIYHYGKTIKDKSTMRRIIRATNKIAQSGSAFTGNIKDFISEVEQDIFSITTEGQTSKISRLKDCLKVNLKDLSDESRGINEISGISTGFKKLDEKLLGLQPGQLVVLAARPAMGKSALALNIATQCCKNHRLPVAFFSLEMLAPELSMRILSAEAKVNSRRMKMKNFNDVDMRNIGTAVQTLSDLPIYINDSGESSLYDIQSQCRKIKAEEGLGIVVIDYLQLMKPTTMSAPREQQISEISRGLKNMAKELECPVIALSQLNRGVESRNDKRPLVSDLRESGSIEQDADIVLLLYRDEVYNPDSKHKGIAEVILGKNRGGEVGTAHLSWVAEYTKFGDLTFQEEPPHISQ